MTKVLIITYYWPPAGGPGVQRWLKFVKYFRQYGVEPIVYIPENPNYPLIDKTFVSEIPSDIEIIQRPIQEPYRFAKVFSRKKTKQMSSGILSKDNPSAIENLMLYVRGNFFIPDARVGWVKPSVEFLSKYLIDNSVDTIITTGPPHSLHLIGLKLKEKMEIKWIADFRDPWTTIHYHKSLKLNKSSEKKHKALEKEVLNSADLVVVTSPTTKREFVALTDQPVEVITNGYDETEPEKTNLDTKFSISHIGSLLSERNPEVLWKVLQDISKTNPLFKKNLHLKFAGAVSEIVKESLKQYGLSENAEFLGYVSHSEALKLQRGSQVLLLIEIDSPETRSIIPGKLFEYLVARRPILALGPENSDIEEIVEGTKAGKFYNYSEEVGLKSAIEKYFLEYSNGTLCVSPEGIERYSRRELTKKMAALINRLRSNSK